MCPSRTFIYFKFHPLSFYSLVLYCTVLCCKVMMYMMLNASLGLLWAVQQVYNCGLVSWRPAWRKQTKNEAHRHGKSIDWKDFFSWSINTRLPCLRMVLNSVTPDWTVLPAELTAWNSLICNTAQKCWLLSKPDLLSNVSCLIWENPNSAERYQNSQDSHQLNNLNEKIFTSTSSSLHVAPLKFSSVWF